MAPPSTRLRLECLEPREVPTATAWLSESFDTVTAGKLPEGWNTWGSDGNSGFAVATRPTLPGRQLTSAGGSAKTGRTWIDNDQPANLSISAAIVADSLVSAQIFVRGKNLESNRPSLYAAQIVRGARIDLVRVVNGSAKTLHSVQTQTYFTGVMVDVTLIARGTTLQVRAQRRDTGEWLSPFGDWQARPMAAIQMADREISGRGAAGLGRAAAYAGTVTFDDLRLDAVPADIRPPSATLTLRPKSRVISGMVRLAAQVSDASGIDRVDFLVDGRLASRRTGPSFSLEFDTRNLSNGTHQIAVRAWDRAGNLREIERHITVANDAANVPKAPRNYDHIRYASLAYHGLAIGETEKRILRDSVDLVIPNARYATAINSVSPDTPQLAYTNLSNVYLELLTDWLNYADRKKVDREAAFYHVTEATPFAGNSPSSLPVNWFWNVGRGPSIGNTALANLTSNSRTGTAGDVSFGGEGESLFIGYPERFAELNVVLAKNALAGWTSVIEYPSAVNRLGQPSAWKPLQVTVDSTNGFRRSGKTAFDVPRDWKATLLGGNEARLFYVRIRTIQGNAALAPAASRILGRDYVNSGGGSTGVIPAFDSSADGNRDGFLSDAEYAGRRTGLDARFEYETRYFFPGYGQMRFAVNPESGAVAKWAIEYQRRFLQANPLADGIFVDNSGGRISFGDVRLLEETESFAWNYASLLAGVSRSLAPNWVLANTSGGGTDAANVVRAVPATIEEFALRPLAHTWSQFGDTANSVSSRIKSANSGTLILDTLSQGGSPTDERTRLAALAYYYLLADPERTMLMTWGGEEPATSWARHWFDAIAFNVGRPAGAWNEFTRGRDPSNQSLEYRIYQRAYGNALVLFKPLSYTSGKGTGSTTSESVTSHQLGGVYRQLRADGTFGPTITSISLRNGEGTILVRG